MTPTTFPCPFCGRKMGVGPELLGRQVRCPHCKQVILAPAAAPAPAPTAPPPAVVPPPPPPVATITPPTTLGLPDPLPQFNVPRPEAQDSIFGEAEEGDDVFGGTPQRPAVPELPPPVAPPPPPVAIYSPPPVAAYSPPPPPIVPFQPPAAVPAPPVAYQPPPAYPAPAPADPFAGFGAAPAYGPPTPAPVPVPVPVAPPPAAVPPNPWAGFDAVPTPRALTPAPAAPPPRAAEPEPLPAAVVDDDEPPEPRRAPRDRRDDRRPRPDRVRPGDAGGGAGALIKIGFFLMIPYALLMTVLAVYGLFIREGGRAPEGHPLSLIPDSRGEFPPAERKKVVKLGVPLDGPLPPELRAELGKTVAVGAVEVEPVSVVVRKLTVVTEPERGKTLAPKQLGKAVVLTMRVKNTSPDLTFHPLDPAFNRREVGADGPPTALVVGKDRYAGGAVSWPFPKGVKRTHEAAQADDDTPLAPGESRTYVVTSDAKSDVVRAVQGARDTIVWRVQVRRGLVEYLGREVPVTALVGVEFKASDVTTED